MNQKGNINVFGFFFLLIIFSSLFLFLGVGIHFILNDYAINPAIEVGKDILNQSGNISSEMVARFDSLDNSHANQANLYDLLFLVMMVSIFITSVISAINTRRLGWLSFYGFLTVGNLLLGLLVYFAIQVRGWILNEIFYNVITETFTSTWFDYFVNNTWWIIFVWYLILLVFAFIDVDKIKSKFIRSEDNNILGGQGRFEE